MWTIVILIIVVLIIGSEKIFFQFFIVNNEQQINYDKKLQILNNSTYDVTDYDCCNYCDCCSDFDYCVGCYCDDNYQGHSLGLYHPIDLSINNIWFLLTNIFFN